MATAEEDMHNTSLKFKCFYYDDGFHNTIEWLKHREQYHQCRVRFQACNASSKIVFGYYGIVTKNKGSLDNRK
jgi:hypothetical protein